MKLYRRSLLTLTFCLFCSLITFSQELFSSYDISGAIKLIIKDDYQSLLTFIKGEGYEIEKFNSNFDKGHYYVLCELKAHRYTDRLRPIESYNKVYECKEELEISFVETDDSKILDITIEFTHPNNFKFDFYVNEWKRLKWDRISYGDFFNSSLKTISTQEGILPTDNIKLLGRANYYGFRLAEGNKKLSKDYSIMKNSIGPNFGKYYYGIDTLNQSSVTIREVFPKFFQNTSTQNEKVVIPLVKSGNIFFVTLSFGNLKKKYILDSGASEVSLDKETYNKLIASGELKFEHRLPDGMYSLADGSKKTFKRTLIPSLSIGKIMVENIEAYIVNNGEPLLLGKSFLDLFKSWHIDNSTNQLILEVE